MTFLRIKTKIVFMELTQQNEDLYRIRHSLAHILAQAVLAIRPNAELGFGPPIDTGFYYDFRLDEPLTPEDLKVIEKKMKHIIKQNQKFESFEMNGSETSNYLREHNQPLKAEYSEELSQNHESLSFFSNGPFTDMCEGPHVSSTKDIPANCFQLDSLAGSYWRGDSSNPMLTRIYGLAFENAQRLQEFITERKLAQERDHRKLGDRKSTRLNSSHSSVSRMPSSA